jgi:TolB-like protein/DNA-binding winged helix-turn-helix (wHTH) protein/Tfp pilus assembly protein PilF
MMSDSRPLEPFTVGDWQVDPAIDTIARGSEVHKLEPRTMRLLICLAETPGSVVSSERLLTEVWAGVVVGPASVYQAISQLRRLLGDTEAEATYIATVPRKGYRLVAPVRKAQQPEPRDAPTSTPPPAQSPVLLAPRPKTRTRTAVMVFAIAIAAVLSIAGYFAQRYRTAERASPSIVVLPFVDLTSEKRDQPFCDGLTEELSNWLAQLPTLRVVARTSAFLYRNKAADVRQIGKALDTNYVLEGSLRRADNKMRVTVQLVDTVNGYHLWSGNYDTSLVNVIAIQEQIARSVADNLEIRLTDHTTLQFAARGSTNPGAYSLYLIARYHQQQRTLSDNEHAIELYREAISADPKFALAYVGLAYALLNQRYFNGRAATDIAADAQPLLAIAEKLRPNLAELYVVRGALQNELLKPKSALQDLQRAVMLDPNSAEGFAELGFLHITSGEPRAALADYSRAAALDPINYILYAQRCLALQDLARLEEATRDCDRARSLKPEASWAYATTSLLAAAQGRTDEALRWNQQAIEHAPDDFELYNWRATWFVALGLPAEALTAYQQARAATQTTAAEHGLLPNELLAAFASNGARAVTALINTVKLDNPPHAESLFGIAYGQLLIGDWRGARAQVDQALRAADLDARTLNSPWLARTGFSYQLIAAEAELETGDRAAAESRLIQIATLIDRLLRGGVQTQGIYELKAQVAALRGDPSAAMLALNRAVALGWHNVVTAEHEPYFNSLRSRADYQALIRRLKDISETLRRGVPMPNKAPASAAV